MSLYIDQFKNMAGLDYAAIADNLSREILVLSLEMPKTLDQIKAIGLNAAKSCPPKKNPKQQPKPKTDKKDPPKKKKEENDVNNFSADATPDVSKIPCVPLIDNYTIGELGGKLFSSFFNTKIQPL